ncbi:hypothetical protein CFIICLFH_0805 [Methylobacterium goesingense]|nr:hypothetical protein CFIICLFH_0805 [Methylobacterium goesingense]
MRRLLAPLSRWLDRRIDARIAAATKDLRSANDVLFGQLCELQRRTVVSREHTVPSDRTVYGLRDAPAVRREGEHHFGHAPAHHHAGTRWVI